MAYFWNWYFLIMGVTQQLLAAGQGFRYAAVDYDGSAAYLTKASALTGGPDSGKLSASLWFRLDGGDGSQLIAFNGQNSVSGNGVFILKLSSDKIGLLMQGALGSITFVTTASYTASSAWHNMLLSVDINNAPGGRTPLLYLDNAADLNVTADSGVATTVDWAATIDNLAVAARYSAANKWPGCLSQMWIAPGVQIDWTSSANRAKFILNGKPVDLGADGTAPGSTPLVFLPNKAPTVGTNAAGGGNFTHNGTPTNCSNAPQ